jgi:hypothetical protein
MLKLRNKKNKTFKKTNIKKKTRVNPGKPTESMTRDMKS